MSIKTVGVIFSSDNSLKGKTETIVDSFLIQQLNTLDYEVCKVEIVKEDKNVIAFDLQILSKQFDVVIVVGDLKNGIVFKALAKATYQNLHLSSKFFNLLEKIQEPCNYSHMLIPAAAKLLTNNLLYPVIYMQRIFVLNKDCLEQQFTSILKSHLLQYRKDPIYTKIIHITCNGSNKYIGEFNDKNVQVTCCKNENKYQMTMSSNELGNLIATELRIKNKFGENVIHSLIGNLPSEMVYSSKESQIVQALEEIEKCFNIYGPENIFLSFNGGKDCTVLMHLVLIVLSVKYPSFKSPVYCVYVRSLNAFTLQDEFIEQCKLYYNLEVETICSGIKEALAEVLEKRPNFKACLMGTRKTDPYSSNLNIFQMTDKNWPQIMRVSPLLDWHYSDIWDYLLYYKVPYCKLYDMGYTSLGNASNTCKNTSLFHYDPTEDKEVYLPAYKMLNETKERNGRNI